MKKSTNGRNDTLAHFCQHHQRSIFPFIPYYSATMIKFLSLEFLGLPYTIPGNIENAVYRLEISALVPNIFKFEKCVTYANELLMNIFKFEKCVTYANELLMTPFNQPNVK